MICYYCGQPITGLITRDHFVPKSVISWLHLYDMFDNANYFAACYECNRNKGDRILFPPIHQDSWLPELYRDQLKQLQNSFEELTRWVIEHSYGSVLSKYWYKWLEDYEEAECTVYSMFDIVRIVVPYDYMYIASKIWELPKDES